MYLIGGTFLNGQSPRPRMVPSQWDFTPYCGVFRCTAIPVASNTVLFWGGYHKSPVLCLNSLNPVWLLYTRFLWIKGTHISINRVYQIRYPVSAKRLNYFMWGSFWAPEIIFRLLFEEKPKNLHRELRNWTPLPVYFTGVLTIKLSSHVIKMAPLGDSNPCHWFWRPVFYQLNYPGILYRIFKRNPLKPL